MWIISGGIIRFFTGFFAFLIISLTNERSCSPANDTDTPTRPALAVLPTLTNALSSNQLFLVTNICKNLHTNKILIPMNIMLHSSWHYKINYSFYPTNI